MPPAHEGTPLPPPGEIYPPPPGGGGGGGGGGGMPPQGEMPSPPPQGAMLPPPEGGLPPPHPDVEISFSSLQQSQQHSALWEFRFWSRFGRMSSLKINGRLS